MDNNSNTLFALYGQNGLPWELIFLTVVRSLISTIGMFFNISLIYVTIKSKSLNSPCNFLIAFDAAACAWFELGSWVSMGHILLGHQFISIRLCCAQLLLPFFCGIYASMSANLLIAFDRLLSIIFPMWYVMRKPTRLYRFCLILLCCSLFPGFIVQTIFRLVVETSKERFVICIPHECIWGWARDQNYALNFVVTGMTVSTYFVIWILLSKRNRNAQNTSLASDVWTRHILKALAFLMALQFAGHTVSSVARLSVPRLQLTVTSSAVTRLLISFLPNIAIAINAPVLYQMNTEYRQAFQNVFKFLRSSSTYVTTNSQQKRWAHRVHRSVSEHQKL